MTIAVDGLEADVLTVLSQAGLITPGTDAFAGSRPAVPTGDGPYTVVIETQGPGGLYGHMQPGPWLERMSAQVSVRAKDYEVAKALAMRCYDALKGLANHPVGARVYLSLRALQRPFDMGQDAVGRCKVGFNVLGQACA